MNYKEAYELAVKIMTNTDIVILARANDGLIVALQEAYVNSGSREKRKNNLILLTEGLPRNNAFSDHVLWQINHYTPIKILLMRHTPLAQIIFGGGYRTLNIATENLSLMQMGLADMRPMYFYGLEFYKPYLGFIFQRQQNSMPFINPQLPVNVVDSVDEAWFYLTQRLNQWYHQQRRSNERKKGQSPKRDSSSTPLYYAKAAKSRLKISSSAAKEKNRVLATNSKGSSSTAVEKQSVQGIVLFIEEIKRRRGQLFEKYRSLRRDGVEEEDICRQLSFSVINIVKDVFAYWENEFIKENRIKEQGKGFACDMCGSLARNLYTLTSDIELLLIPETKKDTAYCNLIYSRVSHVLKNAGFDIDDAGQKQIGFLVSDEHNGQLAHLFMLDREYVYGERSISEWLTWKIREHIYETDNSENNYFGKVAFEIRGILDLRTILASGQLPRFFDIKLPLDVMRSFVWAIKVKYDIQYNDAFSILNELLHRYDNRGNIAINQCDLTEILEAYRFFLQARNAWGEEVLNIDQSTRNVGLNLIDTQSWQQISSRMNISQQKLESLYLDKCENIYDMIELKYGECISPLTPSIIQREVDLDGKKIQVYFCMDPRVLKDLAHYNKPLIMDVKKVHHHLREASHLYEQLVYNGYVKNALLKHHAILEGIDQVFVTVEPRYSGLMAEPEREGSVSEIEVSIDVMGSSKRSKVNLVIDNHYYSEGKRLTIPQEVRHLRKAYEGDHQFWTKVLGASEVDVYFEGEVRKYPMYIREEGSDYWLLYLSRYNGERILLSWENEKLGIGESTEIYRAIMIAVIRGFIRLWKKTKGILGDFRIFDGDIRLNQAVCCRIIEEGKDLSFDDLFDTAPDFAKIFNLRKVKKGNLEDLIDALFRYRDWLCSLEGSILKIAKFPIFSELDIEMAIALEFEEGLPAEAGRRLLELFGQRRNQKDLKAEQDLFSMLGGEYRAPISLVGKKGEEITETYLNKIKPEWKFHDVIGDTPLYNSFEIRPSGKIDAGHRYFVVKYNPEKTTIRKLRINFCAFYEDGGERFERIEKVFADKVENSYIVDLEVLGPAVRENLERVIVEINSVNPVGAVLTVQDIYLVNDVSVKEAVDSRLDSTTIQKVERGISMKEEDDDLLEKPEEDKPLPSKPEDMGSEKYGDTILINH